MIIDVDTRKLNVKKGDMLISNGKQWSVINQNVLLKPLEDRIKQQGQQLENVTKLAEKMDRFIRKLGAVMEVEE